MGTFIPITTIDGGSIHDMSDAECWEWLDDALWQDVRAIREDTLEEQLAWVLYKQYLEQ